MKYQETVVQTIKAANETNVRMYEILDVSPNLLRLDDVIRIMTSHVLYCTRRLIMNTWRPGSVLEGSRQPVTFV